MIRKKKILVVDDEPASRLNIRDLLGFGEFTVEEAENGEQALSLITKNAYDLVLLDIRMPSMDGLTALKEIVRKKPNLPVLVFTAFGTSAKAIEAMKLGAFDYVTKPFDIDEILETVKRALRYKELQAEVTTLRDRLAGMEPTDANLQPIVSKSAVMQRVFKMIGKVAATNATVLIQGETGTGKELVANAIWQHSTRRAEAFIKVNCAAIPEGLMESELFGHERGAFTGAEAQRRGRFELADRGTIFLDEVSEMSPALQSKFLRVLEQGEFHRVGGKDALQVDVRVIAATNRNLETEVKEGKFRRDLYFRLQVMQIEIPPLRERKEDIPLLVDHFLKKYGGRRTLYATKDVYQQLKSYPWPGNVRELENVVQRATVLAQGKYVTPEHIALPPLPGGIQVPFPNASSPYALREIIAKVERDVILKALEVSKWNRTRAAALLKIDRRVLFSKIKEYGLKK